MRVSHAALILVLALAGCGSPVGPTPTPTPTPSPNTAPVADAGVSQTVRAGMTVTLDGSASHDANGDSMTYNWSITRPGGSAAALSSSTTVKPTFVPDAQGTYVATLVVNDGHVNSAPAIVSIVAGSPTQVLGFGFVEFDVSSTNRITSLRSTLTVPTKPPAEGTLFLWPGLQPNGANFLPIDNGVLQPVLTWGPSCAPGSKPSSYSSWWISAQYVNTFGHEPGYIGCLGGPVLPVEVEHQLRLEMTLNGSAWLQVVTDLQTGASVNFSIDMRGQAQNRAEFLIEGYGSTPLSDVVFSDTTFTLEQPEALACQVQRRGVTDSVAVGVPSNGGTHCTVSSIILRAR